MAIGDGANDVSMIQAAHVGVGISGVEVSITYGQGLREGIASGPIGRCGYFSIPILEKITACSRVLELPETVQVDIMYVLKDDTG